MLQPHAPCPCRASPAQTRPAHLQVETLFDALVPHAGLSSLQSRADFDAPATASWLLAELFNGATCAWPCPAPSYAEPRAEANRSRVHSDGSLRSGGGRNRGSGARGGAAVGSASAGTAGGAGRVGLAGAAARTHVAAWACFAHSSVLLTPPAQRQLAALEPRLSRLIERLNSNAAPTLNMKEGLERWWGLVAALLTGCAPAGGCSQSATVKGHLGSGQTTRVEASLSCPANVAGERRYDALDGVRAAHAHPCTEPPSVETLVT